MKIDAQEAMGVLIEQMEDILDRADVKLGQEDEDNVRWAIRALDGKHVVIDAAEYDRLRRALWSLMKGDIIPGGKAELSSALQSVALFQAGLLTEHWRWTPAAHEFARSMREKGGEGA